jgi:hypothetical protein
MHGILHDWNDDDALTILIHIKNAMTPGYSKLLVDDIMMPNCGATRLQTFVDVQTMDREQFRSDLRESRTRDCQNLETFVVGNEHS